MAYSKALQVSPTSAVLLANRALAHLHLENYASAFDDSSLAIRLDPGYVKVRFILLNMCSTTYNIKLLLGLLSKRLVQFHSWQVLQCSERL